MTYDCGHKACDICGGERQCERGSGSLTHVAEFDVCKYCLRRAVKYALDAAMTWAGITIDQRRECHVASGGN